MFRASKLLTRAIRSAPFLLLLPFGDLPPLGPPPPLVGVSVLGPVDRASFLAMSDIQAGDVLLSWIRFDRQERDRVVAHGRFDSPYDLVEMLVEQGPRGPIVMRGKRAGKPKVWSFQSGALSLDRWEARTVPAIGGLDRTRAQVAYSLLLARDSEEGAHRLEVVGASLEDQHPRDAAWILGESATVYGEGGRCERFAQLTAQALRLLNRRGDPVAVSQGTLRWIDTDDSCYQDWFTTTRDRFAETEHQRSVARRNALRKILALDRATHRLLSEARVIDNLGAELYYDEIPKGRRRGKNLGLALMRKSLSIIAEQAPASYKLADSLIRTKRLAESSIQGGENQQRGLKLLAGFRTTRLEKASALISLGITRRKDGQLDLAESCFRTALSLSSLVSENNRPRRIALENLWQIFRTRHDQLLVALYHDEIHEARADAEDDPWVHYAEKPMEENPLERLAEWLLTHLFAESSSALGTVMTTFEIQRWEELQSIRTRAKDATEFEALLLQAIRGIERPVLDQKLSELYLELGKVQILLGKRAEGVRHIHSSLDELERVDRLIGGGPDSRVSHDESVQRYYRQAVFAFLEAGYPFDAVETIDRSRGRELSRHKQKPAMSRTSQLQYLTPDAVIDLTASKLKLTASPPPEEEQRKIRAEIRDLRSIQGLPAASCHSVVCTLGDYLRMWVPSGSDFAPRSAERRSNLLTLSFSEIRLSLDPGTLLLYYVVGSHETYVFALRSSGEPSLSVFHFPVESYVLASKVKNFRIEIEASHEPKASDAVALYDLLVLPAQSLIETSDRIAICADGPLLSLPFTALRHDDKYLAELRPVHRIASVAAFKRLKDRRPRTRDAKLWNIVAFADPRYSEAEGSEDGVREPALTRAIERGLSLAPLPASRVEVENLAESFPSARTFLGKEASETNAREFSASADVLHFACHGLLDSASPYDSSLALATPKRAIPGRDNGLLQAWEVGERLSLKAELVTLSACKTALGDAGSGEGLLGMSWAFQAAGARSVVASTWSVSDRETAELMKRFYRHLSEGLPKDEALRGAQADMIHSGDSALAAPAAWAGFELFGDWR